MRNIGKSLSAFILFSGLVLIPVAAQTGSNPGSSSNKSQSTQSSSPASQSSSSEKLSAADRHFIQRAAEGNQAEVELGKLATEKGSSQDVKQFGQKMVDDHSKAKQELQQIASEKHVRLPDGLSAKNLGTKTHLQKLSGKQFDQAYMHNMVADHTKDVSEFQRETISAKDPEVKSYAQNTLPTLQDHLKMAKQIAPKTTVASSKTSH
jgi:putative membrane protein